MINEKISGINIKGQARIQLFEKGKIIKDIQKENFIGAPGKRWLMACALGQLRSYIEANVTRKKGFLSSNDMFNRLVLTDNVDEVLQTVKVIPGNVIGWADNEPYALGDIDRGTINVGESVFDPDALTLKLVFDFGTDKANGTFKTVGFRSYYATSDYNVKIYQELTAAGKGCCINGTDIYFNYSTSLYKFNATTKQTVQLSNIQNGSVKGFAYYNNKIYYIYDTGTYDQVWAYDLTTDTNSQIVQLPDDDSYGILFDGANFYRTYSSGAYRLYKYDTDWAYISFSVLPVGWTHDISIVNPGWIMKPDGEELDMSDLITTRQNVILAATNSQVVKYGDNYYKPNFAVFYPSVYESSTDTGFARGNNCGPQTGFGAWQGYQNMGSCIVLDTAVTKNDTQTMKVTYTFSITL